MEDTSVTLTGARIKELYSEKHHNGRRRLVSDSVCLKDTEEYKVTFSTDTNGTDKIEILDLNGVQYYFCRYVAVYEPVKED